MPPRWSQHIKLKINAALAACAPACVLSAEAIEELRLSTGLTAAQIKRSAENFRSRVKFEARVYTLEPPKSHDHAADDYAFEQLTHVNKMYKTRFSNEVLYHLVNAIKRPENCYGRQFTDSCVQMLMQTTHLSSFSIRKWATSYHSRNGKVCFAQPKMTRHERIHANKEAMKRAMAEDKAEDLRICALRYDAGVADVAN